MHNIIEQSDSFIDLVLSQNFKNNLLEFLKNDEKNELINIIKNQNDDDLEDYILAIWDFLHLEENLADFLILLSQKNISEYNTILTSWLFSHILKISHVTDEYPEGIIDVSELIKQSITQILFNHENTYVEFDLFELGFPLKDMEWFYISNYIPENSIYIWDELYIQIESDDKLKYMNKNSIVLQDLKWQYISNITNTIVLEWDMSILNTINTIWEKQIFWYLTKEEKIIKFNWEEAFLHELQMLKFDLENWKIRDWERIKDILISKDASENYDHLHYNTESWIERLNLANFLELLNPGVELEEYFTNTQIHKIKRIIEIGWEVFCELDIVERTYSGDYDEEDILEQEYVDEIKPVIMTIQWDMIQDETKYNENVNLVQFHGSITILWKTFILYMDTNDNLWGLMDKNWEIVKIKTTLNKNKINLKYIEEANVVINGSTDKWYEINFQYLLKIEHDDLITQLEKYTSF